MSLLYCKIKFYFPNLKIANSVKATLNTKMELNVKSKLVIVSKVPSMGICVYFKLIMASEIKWTLAWKYGFPESESKVGTQFHSNERPRPPRNL